MYSMRTRPSLDDHPNIRTQIGSAPLPVHLFCLCRDVGLSVIFLRNKSVFIRYDFGLGGLVFDDEFRL